MIVQVQLAEWFYDWGDTIRVKRYLDSELYLLFRLFKTIRPVYGKHYYYYYLSQQ